MGRIPALDAKGLFREETIADLRVGSIRRMVPITAEGLPDPSRSERFLGEITIMTPVGALPLSFEIEAKTLSEAVERFSEAAEKQLERMQDELRRLELEQSSLLAKQALAGGGNPFAGGAGNPLAGSGRGGGSGIILP